MWIGLSDENQAFTHARCFTIVQKSIDKDYHRQSNELGEAVPNLIIYGHEIIYNKIFWNSRIVFKGDGVELLNLLFYKKLTLIAKVRMGPYFTENSNWNSVYVDNSSVSHVWRVAKRNLPSGVYSSTQRTWIQWNFLSSLNDCAHKACEWMLLLTHSSVVDEPAVSFRKEEP